MTSDEDKGKRRKNSRARFVRTHPLWERRVVPAQEEREEKKVSAAERSTPAKSFQVLKKRNPREKRLLKHACSSGNIGAGKGGR